MNPSLPHLLVGRRILSLPDHIGYLCDLDDEEFTTNSVQLTRRVRHLNNTLNHFWNRWRTEYLNELREAHKRSMSKTHSKKPADLSVEDDVIVHSERLPRGLWKLGRIQELLKGQDGHCRAATVKTTASDGQPVLLRRPIQLLYPLELSDSWNRQLREVVLVQNLSLGMRAVLNKLALTSDGLNVLQPKGEMSRGRHVCLN